MNAFYFIYFQLKKLLKKAKIKILDD